MMRLMIVVLASLLATPVFAVDDEPIDHLQMGRRLADNQHYLEALKEFELAYALRQQTILLYEMGKAHQGLGQADKALDLFRRYLVAEDRDAARRTDAESRIRALAPRSAPPVAADNAPPNLVRARYELKRNTGLMTAGIVVLAASYLPALIMGSLVLSYSASDERGMGGSLLVPVLGPFISAGLETHPAWSVPWTVVDGAAQLLGFSMMIAGAVTKRKVLVLDAPLTLAPTSLPGGGGLVAFGRF
jgi:hypothetical protein